MGSDDPFFMYNHLDLTDQKYQNESLYSFVTQIFNEIVGSNLEIGLYSSCRCLANVTYRSVGKWVTAMSDSVVFSRSSIVYCVGETQILG